MKATARCGPSTITVHVPLTFTTRGNSKRIVSDVSGNASLAGFENALIKATCAGPSLAKNDRER